MDWPVGRRHDPETIRKITESNRRRSLLVAEALAARAEAAKKAADKSVAMAEREAERAAKRAAELIMLEQAAQQGEE